MSRVAHIASWLITANIGLTCLLLGAIAGGAELWAAILALLGVSLIGVAVGGLLLETRRLVRRRSLPRVAAQDAERRRPAADPRPLTPVRMDLAQRSKRPSGRGAPRPVRQR